MDIDKDKFTALMRRLCKRSIVFNYYDTKNDFALLVSFLSGSGQIEEEKVGNTLW